jgi:predicted HTH domain antitoxin
MAGRDSRPGEETYMSVHITIELPEGALSALRKNPADFVKEMQLAAAVKWYEMGTISQAKAAEIAGVSREGFLRALERFNVSPFQASPEELAEELNYA